MSSPASMFYDEKPLRDNRNDINDKKNDGKVDNDIFDVENYEINDDKAI